MIPAVNILLASVFYSAACLCAGALLLRLLNRATMESMPSSPLTRLASAFLLGQGLLANLLLLIALAGWFKPSIVGCIAVLAILGGVAFAWPSVVSSNYHIRSVWRDLTEESLPWKFIALLVILLSVVGFMSLGRPPNGDALAFYMVLPKVIAASHRLVPLPCYEDFTQVGLQGEMHYAALMALGSADAAQLFAWPTFWAGTIMLLAIGSKAGLGRRGQWILLVSIFTSSAVIYLGGDGKVDLFAAALGLAAYYWAVQVGAGQNVQALRLTGLFTGLAMVAKFSYCPVLVPGIGLLILWNLVSSFKRAPLNSSLLLAGSLFWRIGFWMILAILPHLFKNYILFGNPLAPFSTPGMGWVDQNWFGPETTRRIVLTYPLALTFGKYWAQYGNLTPLVLAFLPLALLLPKPRSWMDSSLAAITFAALSGVVCWLVLRPSVLSPRYILSTLLLFIPLSARAAEHVYQLKGNSGWLRNSVTGCIVVTLVGTIAGFYFKHNTLIMMARYVTGQFAQCERDGEVCRALSTLSDSAEPGARVLFAGYYRYWLRPDLLQCASTGKETKEFGEKSAEAFWLAVRNSGFRYLVVDRTTHGSLTKNLEAGKLPNWASIPLLHREQNTVVYRLEFIDPPGEPMVDCRQVKPPAWDLVARLSGGKEMED